MVGAQTLDCAAGLSHFHFLYSPQSTHETYLAVMYMLHAACDHAQLTGTRLVANQRFTSDVNGSVSLVNVPGL